MSPLPRPNLRSDLRLALLERRLLRAAEEYARECPSERFSFFWRNLTTGFRNRGKLLSGNTQVPPRQEQP